jgi:hypothetical protein
MKMNNFRGRRGKGFTQTKAKAQAQAKRSKMGQKGAVGGTKRERKQI